MRKILFPIFALVISLYPSFDSAAQELDSLKMGRTLPNFSLSHSYSLLYSNFGGKGKFSSYYLNTIHSYPLKNLFLRIDWGYTTSLPNRQNRLLPLRLELRYQPNPYFQFSIKYSLSDFIRREEEQDYKQSLFYGFPKD